MEKEKILQKYIETKVKSIKDYFPFQSYSSSQIGHISISRSFKTVKNHSWKSEKNPMLVKKWHTLME